MMFLASGYPCGVRNFTDPVTQIWKHLVAIPETIPQPFRRIPVSSNAVFPVVYRDVLLVEVHKGVVGRSPGRFTVKQMDSINAPGYFAFQQFERGIV
jgi:hypothetical protein